MSLSQRYKVTYRKRNFIRFYLAFSFLAIIMFFLSTFGRYSTVVENTPTVEIANWNVKVNDVNVAEEETLSNALKLIPDSDSGIKTKEGKVSPGQSGYFDIIINPEGTDVAVVYTITIDTSYLPDGFNVTNYKIMEDGNAEKRLENNIVTGEIMLVDSKSLTVEDTKTVRFFWNWEQGQNSQMTTEEQGKIIASINCSQKI